MDQSEKSIREGRVYRHQRKNPSSSSSLLDEIYSSIDEGNNNREEGDEEMVFYRETMKTKQSITHVNHRKEEDEEMASVRRACLVDKWMEKKVNEKAIVGRDFDRNLRSNRSSMVFNSSSSSSDSCCGGAFSSSEAESVYGTRSTTKSSSSSRPKPVRTNVSVEEKKKNVGNSPLSNFLQWDHNILSQLSSGGVFTFTHNESPSGTIETISPVPSKQSPLYLQSCVLMH